MYIVYVSDLLCIRLILRSEYSDLVTSTKAHNLSKPLLWYKFIVDLHVIVNTFSINSSISHLLIYFSLKNKANLLLLI